MLGLNPCKRKYRPLKEDIDRGEVGVRVRDRVRERVRGRDRIRGRVRRTRIGHGQHIGVVEIPHVALELPVVTAHVRSFEVEEPLFWTRSFE